MERVSADESRMTEPIHSPAHPFAGLVPGRSHMAMDAFLLPIADVDRDDVAAWSELARIAAEPNPFFEPQFVLPAAEHLGGERISLAVAGRRGGEWHACLPIYMRRRWKGLPLRAFATWRHSYCFLGTPLAEPARMDEALAALLGVGLDGGPMGMLALEWVRADGPVAGSLDRVLAGYPRPPVSLAGFERAALRRRPQADYLDATLRPHHRRELRRLGRRLGEELGAPVEVRDRSDDQDAVEEFMQLEAAGEKGRRGTAFASRPGHAALFREICAAFRARGRLQMLVLAAGERSVAFKCNLVAGDEVFAFKITYDESLARFSPGVQLEQRMVEFFHEQMTETTMDSCADPGNEMINRLWPDRRPLATDMVSAPGPAGWAASHGVGAALRIHNLARRNP
jgi:CelD/BcsL family acetyltransferase involved in cellulose biosynthesis